MKSWLWRLLGVGVLAVSVLAVGLGRVGCRTDSDELSAVGDGPGAGPDALGETRRAERLDKLRQVLFWGVRQRTALVEELIAGRSSLFEAAAGFRAVQQVKEKYVWPAPLPFPGKTEEERLCRQVIAYVETNLRDDPEKAKVVARLEEELREQLERYGSVQLPAPPPFEPPTF